jgi:PTH1 family peptidyl-tRNA hydrolase
VAAYVLSDFAKSDADWLDDLLRGLSDGTPALAEGDTAGFQNAVALRTAPPRSGTGSSTGTDAKAKSRPAAAPAPADPAPSPAAGADPARSPLQRLMDRFRGA